MLLNVEFPQCSFQLFLSPGRWQYTRGWLLRYVVFWHQQPINWSKYIKVISTQIVFHTLYHLFICVPIDYPDRTTIDLDLDWPIPVDYEEHKAFFFFKDKDINCCFIFLSAAIAQLRLDIGWYRMFSAPSTFQERFIKFPFQHFVLEKPYGAAKWRYCV